MRHTLVGITLDICNKDLPRVTTSLLSEPVLNWVIAIMEERCRECGIMNDDPGATLNHYPWIAAIKEKAFNVDGKSLKTSSTATCDMWLLFSVRFYKLLLINRVKTRGPIGSNVMLGIEGFSQDTMVIIKFISIRAPWCLTSMW